MYTDVMNHKTVYHSSTRVDLKVINPKKTLSQDRHIGDYVFATEDKIYALMYLVPRGLVARMGKDIVPPRVVVCASQNIYKKLDGPCALYELPASNFKSTPQEFLLGTELASKKPSIVLGKEIFNSSQLAFKKYGIRLYCVQDDVFNAINKSKDDGSEILKSCQPLA